MADENPILRGLLDSLTAIDKRLRLVETALLLPPELRQLSAMANGSGSSSGSGSGNGNGSGTNGISDATSRPAGSALRRHPLPTSAPTSSASSSDSSASPSASVPSGSASWSTPPTSTQQPPPVPLPSSSSYTLTYALAGSAAGTAAPYPSLAEPPAAPLALTAKRSQLLRLQSSMRVKVEDPDDATAPRTQHGTSDDNDGEGEGEGEADDGDDEPKTTYHNRGGAGGSNRSSSSVDAAAAAATAASASAAAAAAATTTIAPTGSASRRALSGLPVAPGFLPPGLSHTRPPGLPPALQPTPTSHNRLEALPEGFLVTGRAALQEELDSWTIPRGYSMRINGTRSHGRRQKIRMVCFRGGRSRLRPKDEEGGGVPAAAAAAAAAERTQSPPLAAASSSRRRRKPTTDRISKKCECPFRFELVEIGPGADRFAVHYTNDSHMQHNHAAADLMLDPRARKLPRALKAEVDQWLRGESVADTSAATATAPTGGGGGGGGGATSPSGGSNGSSNGNINFNPNTAWTIAQIQAELQRRGYGHVLDFDLRNRKRALLHKERMAQQAAEGGAAAAAPPATQAPPSGM